jgi:hypothetical protein
MTRDELSQAQQLARDSDTKLTMLVRRLIREEAARRTPSKGKV